MNKREIKLQQIPAKGKSSLSKQQQQFKVLTAKVKGLKEEIEKTEILAEQIKQFYQKNLLPPIKKYAKSKLDIAKELDQRRYSVKLSKLQNKQMDALIASYLADAFVIVAPDEEAQKLYNRYHDEPYVDEPIREQVDGQKLQFVADVLKNYDVHLSINDLGDNPDYERILEEIINQKKLQEENKKEKSPKQQLKAEAEALKTALKQKSIRNVYISLAKILHPDKEQDLKIRKEKEELMKEITIAYEQKDLIALLNIEIVQLATDGKYLNQLNTDSLQQYIELLKDQERSLQHELKMAQNGGFINLKIQLSKEQQLKQQIMEEADRYTHATQLYQEYVKSFKDKYELKNYLVHFINNFYHESIATDANEPQW